MKKQKKYLKDLISENNNVEKIKKVSAKGITLVALVITIIILLILAGITIHLTLGERGILKIAGQAQEQHIKAQLKEELELEIANLELEKRGKLTFQDIANRFRELEISVLIEEEDGIQGEYKNYKFIVEENKNVIITERLEGEKPTIVLVGTAIDINGKMQIQIITDEEVQSIEPVNGGTLVSQKDNNNKIFEVSENGTYRFKVVGINGRATIAKVELNNIGEIAEGESFLEAISIVNSSTTKKVKIHENSKEYSVNTIYYDGNMILDGKTQMVGATLNNNTYEFGNMADVATETQEAKNTVILKVNGNLTINSDVVVTACKSSNGYGGPKGLIIYCTGTFTNNGNVSMTSRGAKATGEDVILWKNQDGSFEYIPAIGASGGTSVAITSGNGWGYKNGNNGGNASSRRTGGGGSGGTEVKMWNTASVSSGRGGVGTSYSGGSGGGIGSKWKVNSTIKAYQRICWFRYWWFCWEEYRW